MNNLYNLNLNAGIANRETYSFAHETDYIQNEKQFATVNNLIFHGV